jgi:adenylate cyclase class 2
MKHAGLLEIEIKLPIPSLEVLEPRLRAAGFTLTHPQAPEHSVLWDRDGALRDGGSALRLRRYGATATLTWKGPREADPVLKIRPERETAVEAPEAMEGILRALGFAPALVMEKSRSLWGRGDLEACLDQAPFGCFLELEGSREDIRQALEDLGLEGLRAESRGYGALFQDAAKGR